MTDKEIYDQGYWLHILPLAKHDNWGYEILRKTPYIWTTDLTKFDFKSPEQAREAGLKELKFIMNN